MAREDQRDTERRTGLIVGSLSATTFLPLGKMAAPGDSLAFPNETVINWRALADDLNSWLLASVHWALITGIDRTVLL